MGERRRDSMLFPFRWFSTLLELEDNELREMLSAISHYAEHGEASHFKGAMAALWNELKQRIDFDNQKYAEICVRNRSNGAKGAEYGKRGGRPKKNPEKPRETPTGVLKTPKTPDADADIKEGDINISPESAALPLAAPAVAESVFSFDDFWISYGKKTERKRCREKYDRIGEEDRAVIKRQLPVYLSSTPELRYRKNPLTWLNGRCWEDELPVMNQSKSDNLAEIRKKEMKGF